MYSQSNRSLSREILTLAWPILFHQIMDTMYQYVDKAMVGSLGTDAMAAIGSTATVSWLVGGIASSLAVGFLPHLSNAIGSRDLDRAKRLTSQACFMVLIVGSLLTVITLALSPFIPVWMQVDRHVQPLASQYFALIYAPMLLRTASSMCSTILWAVGDTRTPMIAGIVTNCFNAVVNFFLLFPTRTTSFGLVIPGAGLGVIGAGLASFLCFCVEAIWLIAVVLRRREIAPDRLLTKPDPALLLPCLRTALPNLLQKFGASFAAILYASMINAMGAVATATHAIVGTVGGICGWGFRGVAASMVGRMVGAGEKLKLRQFPKTLILLEEALALPLCVLVFLFAPQLMGLFSEDTAVIELGVFILRIFAVSEPFFHIACIYEQVQFGLGDTMTPFLYNITSVWFVQLAGTFICTQFFGLGLTAAWACNIAQRMLLVILFARKAKRTLQ